MTEAETVQSRRRSGRNTALFGLAIVLLASLLFVVEWGHLGEPLGRRSFFLPRGVLLGVMLAAGLYLLCWGATIWRRLCQR